MKGVLKRNRMIPTAKQTPGTEMLDFCSKPKKQLVTRYIYTFIEQESSSLSGLTAFVLPSLEICEMTSSEIS